MNEPETTRVVVSPPPAQAAASPAGKQEWSPEVIKALGDTILPYVDRFLKLHESKQRHEAKLAEGEAQHTRKTTLALLGFAFLIIGVMSWLTAIGKVSGDALLFLVGTVVGGIFTMLQRQLFEGPSVEVVTEE